MPKQEKEEKALQAQEQQSESLANSKKIDLYINNPENEPKGISIMNVFSRMGKRFHIYVFVIIICFIVGLLAPTMMYTFKNKKESAVAILGLDYSGAAAEKAPDGSALDITYLKSSDNVQEALNNVTLAKQVTAAQVEANLEITGVLTDSTKQQMEILSKLEEVKNVEYATLLREFTKKYRTQYIISLKNTFGINKVKLSSSDLSHLLTAITSAYNDFFIRKYQDIELPVNEVGAINVEFLDYLDILDKASVSLSNLQTYCDNRSALMPDFRADDGLSFADLSSTIGTLKSAKINDLYAFIYMNNVCKDRTILLDTYQSRKDNLESQIAVVEAEITNTTNSMNNCAKDIKEIRTMGGTPEQIELKSAAYNGLVLDLATLNARKTALEEELALVDYRITVLNGQPATDAEVQMVEEKVADVIATAKGLFATVTNNSKQLFDSNSYQNRYMHAIITHENESLRDNLKLFILGAAVGLLIGLAIWIVDGFVLENREIKKFNDVREEKEVE